MGLRVLCVTPWLPNTESDGRYNFILHSLRALQELGHDVTVLLTRPWVPSVLARLSPHWAHAQAMPQLAGGEKGLHVEAARYLSIPRYILSEYGDGLYDRGVRRQVQSLIDEHDIQVVHAHTERSGMCAVNVGKACGVPAVVTLHGINTAPQALDTATKRARLRACLDGAARVVLVGEPLREYFAPLAGSDAHFRVVPNGFFLHSHVREDRPFSRTRRFVSVSNLVEGKGIDLNLRALALLDAAGLTDWTYDVVGDGAERAALTALTAELRLNDRVVFHGALAHDRAMQVLSTGDVFILPSYREAFGVAYLEAMACGLLAIGVQGQGPSAFVHDGHTGRLVAPRDVESLFRAMRYTIDEPELARRMAEAGRALVMAEFTWRRHAEKLSAVYDEALAP